MEESQAPRWKKKLKAGAIKAEVPFGIFTVLLYGFSIVAVFWLQPALTQAELGTIILIASFTAAMQALIASLKSDDTTD
jgi:hypothetical protein